MLGLNLYKDLSPLSDRYGKIVAPLSEYLSESALIKYRLKIEISYLIALSKVKVARKLTTAEKSTLKKITENLGDSDIQNIKNIEEEVHHDIKAIELFLRKKLKGTSLEDLLELLHYCLTSEDVNNLAYRLMLRDANSNVILPTLKQLIINLKNFSLQNSTVIMMARTHGQDAIPTTLGKETAIYAVRLFNIYQKLSAFELCGKLNGAIGGWNAHAYTELKIDWIKFSKNYVESLGLKFNEFTTQINPYDDVVGLLSIIHLMNSIMIDFNQDMWRYISDGWLKQKVEKKSVGSSTMAQKVNPINFENSEGNAQIANGLIEALNRTLPISRLQRDLSNSTVIRNIAPTLGHTLLVLKSAISGLEKVHPDKQDIENYLNNNWSILAEPLQILLRRHGINDSYNVVKNQIMGKKLSEKEWRQLIQGLEVSPSIKSEISKLKPSNYIGYCTKIVKDAEKHINL